MNKKISQFRMWQFFLIKGIYNTAWVLIQKRKVIQYEENVGTLSQMEILKQNWPCWCIRIWICLRLPYQMLKVVCTWYTLLTTSAVLAFVISPCTSITPSIGAIGCKSIATIRGSSPSLQMKLENQWKREIKRQWREGWEGKSYTPIW